MGGTSAVVKKKNLLAVTGRQCVCTTHIRLTYRPSRDRETGSKKYNIYIDLRYRYYLVVVRWYTHARVGENYYPGTVLRSKIYEF